MGDIKLARQWAGAVDSTQEEGLHVRGMVQPRGQRWGATIDAAQPRQVRPQGFGCIPQVVVGVVPPVMHPVDRQEIQLPEAPELGDKGIAPVGRGIPAHGHRLHATDLGQLPQSPGHSPDGEPKRRREPVQRRRTEVVAQQTPPVATYGRRGLEGRKVQVVRHADPDKGRWYRPRCRRPRFRTKACRGRPRENPFGACGVELGFHEQSQGPEAVQAGDIAHVPPERSWVCGPVGGSGNVTALTLGPVP